VLIAGRVVKEAGRMLFPGLAARRAELLGSGERLLAAARERKGAGHA